MSDDAKEAQYKAQVANLHAKLTQAGSHLKNLAQDNARLKAQLAELESKPAQPTMDSHINELVSLMERAVFHEKEVPDVSTHDQLREYLQSIQQRLDNREARADQERKDAESKIESLKQQIQELKHTSETDQDGRDKLEEAKTKIETLTKRIEELETAQTNVTEANARRQEAEATIEALKDQIKDRKNTQDHDAWTEKEKEEAQALITSLKAEIEELKEAQKSSSPAQTQPKVDTDACDITSVQQSIANLVEDVENGMVENSLPPEILSALEDLRTRWSTQVKSAEKDQDSLSASQQELKRQITQQQLSINDLSEERDRYQMEKEELANQADEDRRVLEKTRAQLQAAEQTKKENEQRIQQLQQEHQSLLGKLSHIKETLAPRLEADKQLRHQVTDLTEQLTSTRQSLEQAQYDMMRRDEEASHILSQREQEISQLQHRLEQVQQAYEELQVNAMQNEARRNELEELCEHQEKELETLKQRMQEQAQEHDLERASLSNLQTVLEEFQATKDAEVRAAVEHIERQLDVAKRSWAEYQERARIAESSLEQYQHDVAKTQQYEREIKEKNLLIGKLRHEAIILNEHLIEAMRRLKEESSESNVDRQLITNLIVGFFLAPRGDRKRFEILTIIASVLQMTDEQKEQIGLQRPNKGARSSPSGWTSPQQQQQQQQQATSDTRESFTDAWISFLLKESSAYGRNLDNLTTASAPTSPYQKPTTHNDEQQTQQAQP